MNYQQQRLNLSALTNLLEQIEKREQRLEQYESALKREGLELHPIYQHEVDLQKQSIDKLKTSYNYVVQHVNKF